MEHRKEPCSVKVEHQVWHALKLASVRLETSVINTLTLIAMGDARAVKALQVAYREVGR